MKRRKISARKRVGAVALRETNGRQRRRKIRRAKALQLDCARLPPGLHGGSGRRGETVVPREHIWQALFVEHRERFLQAAQEIRGGRVGEIKTGIGLEHRPPVPVAADQLRRLRGFESARADGVEGQSRREHQPLLASGDGDVDAPLLVPILDRSKRRDRVDKQQRRMSGRVDCSAHGSEQG